MSFKNQIEAVTTELLEPIIKDNNFELVDVEYVKEANNLFLRIYIDKEGGITVDDCEIVSRAIDIKLDKIDPITDPYILEVSSPGLDRPLKKEKDYLRSIGKLVEIKLYKSVDGEKEFTGILEKYLNEVVTISIEDKSFEFNLKDIAIIRLAVVF